MADVGAHRTDTPPPISCDWSAGSSPICFAPGAVVFVSLAGETIRTSCAAHAAPFRRRICVPFVEQTPAEWWAELGKLQAPMWRAAEA